MGDSMGFLLTDDEVVAAAIQREKSWPHPLPTVELTSDSLLSAGARGARSLLVREMARTNDSSLVLDEALSSLVDQVGDSTVRAIAYVVDISKPSELAGSSTYLYLPSDDTTEGVLDLVSSSGVHDLRGLSAVEAISAFFAVVENTFNFGIRNSDAVGDPVLFVSTNLGPDVAVIRKGQIGIGKFVISGGTEEFEQKEQSERWDTELLALALGLDTHVKEV